MKILFYLPVVTPWWFDNIVVHLIRAVATAAEVHVIVPPLWRNTGISPDQLSACADLKHVRWHMADGEDHPSLRTSPVAADELVEFVQSIGADYTVCRSADITTPARFPGIVRFVMEGGAPPLSTAPQWVVLQPGILDHGGAPDLTPDLREALDVDFAPHWSRLASGSASNEKFRLSRTEALGLMGLPEDRKIIALPLEYEHEENFFGIHRRFGRNADLVAHVADGLDDDFVLAVTNHPLNDLYSDTSDVERLIASLGGRVRLVRIAGASGSATNLLAKHCDGMILENSRSFAACAFFGAPVLRLSRFETADWLLASDELEPFVEAIRMGTARGPRPEHARTWFAYHVANDLFDPRDIGAPDIIDRLDGGVRPNRWSAGLDRYHQYQQRSQR